MTPDRWSIKVLPNGRIRATVTVGENAGQILEWNDASQLINSHREAWQRLDKVAEAIGLKSEWKNSKDLEDF